MHSIIVFSLLLLYTSIELCIKVVKSEQPFQDFKSANTYRQGVSQEDAHIIHADLLAI